MSLLSNEKPQKSQVLNIDLTFYSYARYSSIEENLDPGKNRGQGRKRPGCFEAILEGGNARVWI